MQGKSTLKVTRAAHSAEEVLSYNLSPSMQLSGIFGTFYVLPSGCAGAMPMVRSSCWGMT